MNPETSAETLRSRFLRTFAKIPLKLRNEIVAVIDGEGITWSVANIEVKGKTEKGDQIIKHMEELGLLSELDER